MDVLDDVLIYFLPGLGASVKILRRMLPTQTSGGSERPLKHDVLLIPCSTRSPILRMFFVVSHIRPRHLCTKQLPVLVAASGAFLWSASKAESERVQTSSAHVNFHLLETPGKNGDISSSDGFPLKPTRKKQYILGCFLLPCQKFN